MVSQEDALLGRIALHYKLVTNDNLNAAVRQLVTHQNPGGLGAVLVEMRVITDEQHKWLQQAQVQFLAKQGGSSAGTSMPAAQAVAAAPAPVQKPSAPRPQPAAAAPAPAPAPPPSAPRPQGQVHNLAPAPIPAAIHAPIRSGALTLREVLAKAVELRASDVHIHSGAPMQVRIGGTLRELKLGQWSPEEVQAIIREGLTGEEIKRLDEELDLDAALVLPGVGRFRASYYKQQRGFDAVFRPVPPDPPTLAQLGLPSSLSRLADFHQGLVLFTGPAGSGKSSTLAAIVEMLNSSRKDHIITVEDPIEYVFSKKTCVVNQRQAGKHTRSFANALRAALREDPDIIVIGELRDLETIQLAITAAETGHLVLGTLHTNNAIRTINRVLDVFPPKQQSQIRAMVSESLRAIVSQRLIPTADGARRLPALEVLYVKPSISNLIREEKTFQIRSVMQTGKSDGMMLLDDSIAELVKSGQVAKETARRFAEDPKRFA